MGIVREGPSVHSDGPHCRDGCVFVLGLRIVVSEALRRHFSQLLRQRYSVLSRLYASLASHRIHRRVSAGFVGDHVTFMFPYTALSLVRPWTHAHASVYEVSGIFPFSSFSTSLVAVNPSTTASCTKLFFVIGGRRALGYGYGDMDADFASTFAFNRRWWRPSSRVLARQRLRDAEVQS